MPELLLCAKILHAHLDYTWIWSRLLFGMVGCSVLLDWSIRFDSIQFGWCGQLGLVVLPTTLILWVSLTPWRKGFPVIAGLPLSSPPWGNARILLLSDISFWGWGPWDIICWLDPSPLPFKFDISFHNAILTTQRSFCWLDPRAIIFWLDPSPVPFKFEVSLPNATLITQRFLVGPLGYFWGLRPSPLPFEFEFSLPTWFLLHNNILLVGPLGYYFLVGPLAFAFQILDFVS